jgi:transposase
MDEFNKIRKAYFIDNKTINEISLEFKRSWATIRRIINTSRDEFSLEKKQVRSSKVSTQEVMDAIIDKIQEEDRLRVKKKQRATAKKLYEELTERGIYHGSQRRMQELVHEVRTKLALTRPKSFLPLEFSLGSTAQVDHGEIECIIAGERSIYFLFVMSVPGASLHYCQLFATKAQEAWGEFHERAFQFFEGIFPRLVYDNDTVLIKNIKGEKRLMTDFALHLVEHYRFESTFCNPAAGNEKGSVENAVGYCRRNYLSGCPKFEDKQQANAYLEDQCRDTIANGVHYKLEIPLQNLKQDLATKLQPLLPRKEWRRWLRRQVNSYQLVEIDGHCYSMPEKYVLKYVRVGIGAELMDLFCEEELIAKHNRQFMLGRDSLFLDHYLDQLCRKPGALWDCKAIREVSEDKLLLALWEKLMTQLPKLAEDNHVRLRSAQSDFIEVLMLRKRYTDEEWREGIQKALLCGSSSAASIECIIRGVLSPEVLYNQTQAMGIEHKLMHINIPKWECDLSSYATLTEKEELC